MSQMVQTAATTDTKLSAVPSLHVESYRCDV